MIALLDAIHAITDALESIPCAVHVCALLVGYAHCVCKIIGARERYREAYDAAKKAFLETLATHDEKLELLTDINDLGDFIGAMREAKLRISIEGEDGIDLEVEQTELIHRVVEYREKMRLRKDQETEFTKQFDAQIEKLKAVRGERRKEIKQKPLRQRRGFVEAPKYDSDEFKSKRRT